MDAQTAFADKIAATYPLQRHTYRAWYQSGVEIDLHGAASLQAACDAAAVQCSHKDHFSILAVDTMKRTATLHHFVVKKSTKRFVSRPANDGHYQVREGALYAEPLFSQQVTAFAPVAPWRWSAEDYIGEKHGRLPANSPLLAGQVRS